ncbi:protein roadkill-like [Planococcus citri]|uniref:protein roadkill-like n=1 Tax=Planococcus citri TaxID=170843 RepID=UPI0031F746B9
MIGDFDPSDWKVGISPDAKVIGDIVQKAFYRNGIKHNSVKWTVPNLLSDHSVRHPVQKFASKIFYIYRNLESVFLWRLVLERIENAVDYYSVFLRFIPWYGHKEVFAKIELSIADKSENKLLTCDFGESRRFDVKNDINSIQLRFHAPMFIEYSDHEESLVILCDIVQSYLPEFSLLKDLERSFDVMSSVSGDVTLLSNDGKTFKAHRIILSARSSVFAARISHDITENLPRKVKIEDCNGEVLGDMLRYIYTGKPEKLNLLAGDLLSAADKYNLRGLKVMCEETLLSTLSVNNAVEMLRLSDSCKADLLKSEVINFIMLEENVSKVMATSQWDYLKETHLLKELCQAFADRQKTAKKSA